MYWQTLIQISTIKLTLPLLVVSPYITSVYMVVYIETCQCPNADATPDAAPDAAADSSANTCI
jgi:hypothetical protein